ncbi:signal peptidase II [Tomitella cavernea]|uniref:Lipoprotein signal peptidase n=2 Tax=Tomitella cavernea TaxID=1387982 RepID=A0ABP9CTN1_9ACTN|nr:signal peptidase II [Tomitella cavernea]
MTGEQNHGGGDASGRRVSRPLVLAAIAVIVLTLDIVTKVVVVAKMTPGQPVPLIGDDIRFTLIRNPGAAFSMATGMTWILTIVALLVVAGIIRYGRRLTSAWWAVGLGLVLGGALGNLVDRLFRAPGPLEGHVVDFIAVGSFPVFNIADSGITVGAILLAALALFGVEPQQRPVAGSADDAVSVGDAEATGDTGSPSDAETASDADTADEADSADDAGSDAAGPADTTDGKDLPRDA